MLKIFKFLIALMLLLSSFALQAERIDYGEFTIAQLKEQAATIHPAGLYILASKLYKTNKKDEAVFWVAVGHLRFKFHLATKPSSQSLHGPSLFSTLQNFIASPINDYAGINPTRWVTITKDAKQWDLDNKNRFTSKSKYKLEYAASHVEMDDMIQFIKNNKDKIRKNREETALNQ